MFIGGFVVQRGEAVIWMTAQGVSTALSPEAARELAMTLVEHADRIDANAEAARLAAVIDAAYAAQFQEHHQETRAVPMLPRGQAR